MRNKLIHEYFGVDMELVWETVVEELPALKLLVSDMLHSSRQRRERKIRIHLAGYAVLIALIILVSVRDIVTPISQ